MEAFVTLTGCVVKRLWLVVVLMRRTAKVPPCTLVLTCDTLSALMDDFTPIQSDGTVSVQFSKPLLNCALAIVATEAARMSRVDLMGCGDC